MNRHYYVSNNLDDLESLEHELEAEGISLEQIHVLSDHERDVEDHHLPAVSAMMKQDVAHSGKIGALIGLTLALLVLGTTYLNDWAASGVGWMPFIFLAAILFAFCVWEGGFVGIQKENVDFQPFREKLAAGQHVFFVDVNQVQEPILDKVVRHHPELELAGTGNASPAWLIGAQKVWHQFKRTV
ncbi:magnesium transporter [Nitrincola sp. MINF-07-Sa-05]|uniref:magnesium transporter n=1 Tax=Nitrincola salilacus TaxID=3400273 RepID=UPI00391834A8